MSRGYVVKASGGVVWIAMAVLLAALVVASPAGAAPKGIFGVFGGCPVSAVGDGVCVYGQVVGGVLRIGRATAPIDRTVTLHAGGLRVEEGESRRGWDLMAPSGGTIMSKTPIEIPGGLNGLAQCDAIGGRVAQASCAAAQGTEVTATIEVVAAGSDPAFLSVSGIFGVGPLMVLPARVHLGNVFLGNSCYLGSGSHPIILEMTVGATSPPAPNKPISGHLGGFDGEQENGLGLTTLGSSALVDNAFSIPVAEGCGGQLSSLIDPMLDARLGLPSNAGHNTAILNTDALDLALAEEVIKSEE
jgi:hypothetical protein